MIPAERVLQLLYKAQIVISYHLTGLSGWTLHGTGAKRIGRLSRPLKNRRRALSCQISMCWTGAGQLPSQIWKRFSGAPATGLIKPSWWTRRGPSIRSAPVEEFIAAITQHIPHKSFQVVRYGACPEAVEGAGTQAEVEENEARPGSSDPVMTQPPPRAIPRRPCSMGPTIRYAGCRPKHAGCS